jgi:hypothetical protein
MRAVSTRTKVSGVAARGLAAGVRRHRRGCMPRCQQDQETDDRDEWLDHSPLAPRSMHDGGVVRNKHTKPKKEYWYKRPVAHHRMVQAL